MNLNPHDYRLAFADEVQPSLLDADPVSDAAWKLDLDRSEPIRAFTVKQELTLWERIALWFDIGFGFVVVLDE